MGGQLVGEEGGEGDRAALVGLGLAEVEAEPWTSVTDSATVIRPAVEVDPTDAEGADLTGAQAGVGGEADEGRVPLLDVWRRGVSTCSAVRNTISAFGRGGDADAVAGVGSDRSVGDWAVASTRRRTLRAERTVPGAAPASTRSAMKRRTSDGPMAPTGWSAKVGSTWTRRIDS